MNFTAERATMLGVWGLATLGCLLGAAAPPGLDASAAAGEEALSLLRVVATAALVVTVLLGPGLLWRALAPRRRQRLAYVPLPGLAILAASGGLAWALAGDVEPRTVCSIALATVLGALLGGLIASDEPELLVREERRALLVVGCVLGLAVARSLWSAGPEGELYGGTIARSLEVGDRSDSRISFHLVQLVAHGAGPYSELAGSYLLPYNFSSRGPISGLAATPFVFATGGKPPTAMPEQPWLPFDPQGFMAYRLAMMAFACTAFLALWQLVRQLAGSGAARLALLLAATTPFLVHEVWFTWPKMLAATFVLLAALALVERRPLVAGLLLGAGYLTHPGALLGLAALGLVALWPQLRPDWRRPDLLSPVLLVGGVAVAVIGWRLLNGDHYMQSGFLDYLTATGFDTDPSVGHWLAYRAASLSNTLVPLSLPLLFGHETAVNVPGGSSPAVVHFFFQYWNGVPFGLAIVFFPLLLASLWRAWRRWPWPVFVVVVAPLAAFAAYWGSSPTGMLREGLQAWVLALIGVVACEQAAGGFPWLRSKPVRAVLGLRALEVILIALVPALATAHVLIARQFLLVDTVALLAVAGFAAALARAIWSLPDEDPRAAEGR